MIANFAINTAWLLLMIVISGLIFIRVAPHRSAAEHLVPPIGATPDAPVIMDGSAVFVQVFAAPPAELLTQLNSIALATPRTHLLAGSVEEGMITYVTRSRVFGFPDYTTVQVEAQAGGSLATLYGRLRFGKSDLGVNRGRIRGWLRAVEALK